jgi:hypothetical protein
MNIPSQNLAAELNRVVMQYHTGTIIEHELMTHWQNAGYHGPKRRCRQHARWALESAAKIRCALADLYKFQTIPNVSTIPRVSGPVIDLLKMEHEIHETTSAMIVQAKKMAYDESCLEICGLLESCLNWETKNCIKIRRDISAIGNTSDNMTYLQIWSEKMHEKWKEKERSETGRDISY